jgi:hypothetical protein
VLSVHSATCARILFGAGEFVNVMFVRPTCFCRWRDILLFYCVKAIGPCYTAWSCPKTKTVNATEFQINYETLTVDLLMQQSHSCIQLIRIPMSINQSQVPFHISVPPGPSHDALPQVIKHYHVLIRLLPRYPMSFLFKHVSEYNLSCVIY